MARTCVVKQFVESDSILDTAFNKEENNEIIERLANFKILLLGAGGLGCDMLKDLVMVGFREIHVIDMDTIDYSNLNRQFLFRKNDVGREKAVVAAEFINKRVPEAHVTPHVGDITKQPPEFFTQFDLVIMGLDNLAVRRWTNSLLFSLITYDKEGNPERVIPILNGGSEGFLGSCDSMAPPYSRCFDCTIENFPPQQSYPLCTIASVPRLPEHCIAYVSELLFQKQFPNTRLDTDNADHINWVYEKALERAAEFKIEGVTRSKTLGVLKNIITAVASTNAIVSAIVCHEAFKFAIGSELLLDNFLLYNGTKGAFLSASSFEKNPNCLVCSSAVKTVVFSLDATLQELIEELTNVKELQLKKPSLKSAGKTLFMQNPPSLRAATEGNLSKKLSELGIVSGTSIAVNDPTLINPLIIIIKEL